MKKIISLILVGILAISMAGCGSSGNSTDSSNEGQGSAAKSKVVYFSATKNTEKIAKYIAEIKDCDIEEIVPEKEYTEEDLTYSKDCRANKEQDDGSARPEISNKLELDDYDTIYLGYPIWMGKEPKIIRTLLDNYDLRGKTIIPFCTSGGTGIEDSVQDIRSKDSALNVLDGKKFEPSAPKEDVQAWLETLK